MQVINLSEHCICHAIYIESGGFSTADSQQEDILIKEQDAKTHVEENYSQASKDQAGYLFTVNTNGINHGLEWHKGGRSGFPTSERSESNSVIQGYRNAPQTLSINV